METDSVGSRSEGRYEVKLPLREPFTDARLTRNAQLLSLVKGAVAGDHLEIDVSVLRVCWIVPFISLPTPLCVYYYYNYKKI